MTKLVLIMALLMMVNALVLVTVFRHGPQEALHETPASEANDKDTAEAQARLPAASHVRKEAEDSEEIAKRRAQRRDANAASEKSDSDKALVAEPAKPVVLQDPDYKTPFFTGYRPLLVGECKKLFRKFKNDPLNAGEFKSFAYSYDGAFAACASTVSEQNQQAADRVAIEECESNRRSSLESARCRIYAIE